MAFALTIPASGACVNGEMRSPLGERVEHPTAHEQKYPSRYFPISMVSRIPADTSDRPAECPKLIQTLISPVRSLVRSKSPLVIPKTNKIAIMINTSHFQCY